MLQDLGTSSNHSTNVDDPDPDIKGFNITGHNLVLRPLHVEGKTKGGIILASKTQQDIQYLMNVCKVLKLGPRAYVQDMFKETGPWCKEGDFVLIPKIGGQKILFKGTPLTIIPCDRVIAVLDNPKDVDPNFNISTSNI